jgi:hypothetical protein
VAKVLKQDPKYKYDTEEQLRQMLSKAYQRKKNLREYDAFNVATLAHILGETDYAVSPGGARASEGATGATGAVSSGSEEADIGPGAEAVGGTRPDEGASGSATGTTGAVSSGSEEAGTGTGAEARGETDGG